MGSHGRRRKAAAQEMMMTGRKDLASQCTYQRIPRNRGQEVGEGVRAGMVWEGYLLPSLAHLKLAPSTRGQAV